jgi:uroporphyrinogen-III synthase
MRHGRGARLLHLAGDDRAGDLAGELAAAGITVQTVVIYRAVMVAEFPHHVRDALKAGTIDGVLHFSRRSAESYLACARAAGVLDAALAPSHYCLSRVVAEPLAIIGARRIEVAGRPNEAALIGLVEV